MARQGYANGRFEVGDEEEVEVIDEFYTEENIEKESIQYASQIEQIQKELQQSVQSLN